MAGLNSQVKFNAGPSNPDYSIFSHKNNPYLNVNSTYANDLLRGQEAFPSTNDIDLLENLLNSPSYLKSTVEPAEIWNGTSKDCLFEDSPASDYTQPSSAFQDTLQDERLGHNTRYGLITPEDSGESQKLNSKTGRKSNGNEEEEEEEEDDDEEQPSPAAAASNTQTKQARRRSAGHRPTPSSHSRSSSSRSGVAGKPSPADSHGKNDDVKRERFLKRNRVAASKCRQKKKEYIGNLEERARELTSNRNHLLAYVATLKDEIIALKSELLNHSECDCVAIRDYLRREASLLSEHMGSSEYTNLCKEMGGSPCNEV